jgi:hypothetical protein
MDSAMTTQRTTIMPDGLLRQVPRARTLEEGARNLDELGVTIHENFLTPDTLRVLQDRLIEQAEMEREQGVAWFNGEPEEGKCAEGFIRPGSWIGTPKGEPFFQNLSFLVNKGRAFIDVAANDLSLGYVRHLLGERFNMIALSGIIVGKGAPLQDLHFDQLVMPFVAPMPVVMNIFVLLTDFDEDMGATRFVPGTHLLAQEAVNKASTGSMYGYFPDQRDTVPAVAKAGDAIIWDGRVWHGQGASTSDKIRRSISMIYARPFLKPIELFAASITDEVYATLSEAEKELFDHTADGGWGARFSPRHAHDRRSNTNAAFPYVPELRRGSPVRGVRFDKIE